MTAMTLRQNTRPWTRRVRRAITYGPFARLSDGWAASRDAQTVLPSLLQQAADTAGELAPTEYAGAGPAGWDTPRTVFLGQLGRGRAEKEWLHYRKDIAGWLVSLAEAQASLQAARRELRKAERALAGLTPLTEDDLAAPRSGEQRTLPAVIKARRMQDHDARRRSAEARVRQLGVQVADHEAAAARLSEPIRLRFEVARTRADLVDAYVRRRRAYYLGRLIRRQSEAGRIRPLIRADWPERPAWMDESISPDLSTFVTAGDGTGATQEGDA